MVSPGHKSGNDRIQYNKDMVAVYYGLANFSN